MNKIKEIMKGFLGIAFFFIFQIMYSFLLSDLIKNANIWIKNIYLLGCEFILCIIFALINLKRLKHDFKDFQKNYKKYLKKGLKYWVTGLIFMVISNLIITLGITQNIAGNEEANRIILKKYPLYGIIATTILAPFLEELVFRANFKDAFKKRWIYVLTTSLIFAGVHLITNFKAPIDLLYIFPYLSMALALSFAYYDTNNIFTTITIHTIHNTIAVILLMLGGM